MLSVCAVWGGMEMVGLGRISMDSFGGNRRERLQREFGAATIGVALALNLMAVLAWSAETASPSSRVSAGPSSLEASTSEASRRDALRSIPLEKLSAENRAKVESVLSDASVFRRLPVRVVDCDPDMYLFLVRHPDVVVNIWEAFKISRLQLRETGEGRFRIAESAGTTTNIEYVYQSHDTHVIYGEGVYQGPLLVKPVKGRGVVVLKSGYVQETNDRYYITSRMDCFLSIEPAGAELVTKTVSPLVGKTVDNNFIQTLSFIGSLSRTAEVNSRGVQRLASQLSHVAPDVRIQLVELAAAMPGKYKGASNEASQTKLAARPSERK